MVDNKDSEVNWSAHVCYHLYKDLEANHYAAIFFDEKKSNAKFGCGANRGCKLGLAHLFCFC